MVDLSTTWLGLSLKSPLILGAGPLSKETQPVVDAVMAGAGAVVMYSLFEEQLTAEQLAAHRFIDAQADTNAEARTFMPDVDVFSLDAEPYLRQLQRLKGRVDVPVVASLNGTTPGGWTSYARQIEDAGASAIELNLYEVATSPEEPGSAVEKRQIEVVASVVETVKIPVTVKLSPFYASVPAFVKSLERTGARGVTLFNRFYQPDIDLETLDVDRTLHLSTSAELPLRLHALALISPSTPMSLACTGGVHSGLDAAKALLTGAHVVQLTSALLRRGPRHIGVIRDELVQWLRSKGYASSADARGVLDFSSAPDSHAWERLNYARMLDGWAVGP